MSSGAFWDIPGGQLVIDRKNFDQLDELQEAACKLWKG